MSLVERGPAEDVAGIAGDAWLADMADAAPLAMIAVDAHDLRILALNPAAQRAARPAAAQAVGLRLDDAFPFLDQPLLLELVAAAGGMRPMAGRLRIETPLPGWDVAVAPMRRTRGVVAPVLLTASVPADLLSVEALPGEPGEERSLTGFLAQLPAAIFIIEAPDGRVTFKSRLVDEVLGAPSEDLADARRRLRGWAIHPDGRPYEITDYPSRRALMNGETVAAERMIYRRGDGRLVELEIYAGPVRDQARNIVAAAVAAFDVTERKRAEARLRESEKHLRLAVEAGGLGTWEVDLVRGVSRLGPEFAAMLGLPARPLTQPREVVASVHVHPDDLERVRGDFERALEAGEAFRCEYRARTAEGLTRWFVSHGQFLRDAQGRAVRAVGVVADITDRRTREQRLRETIESRELLLREADHRIKNSLQLVASLLSLQRARLADADAIDALDSAIRRVIAVSETHKALHQSSDLQHVNFADMLRDLCAHVGSLNPALTFAADLPPLLQLDTARAIPLGLIASELLTNAAKHAYPDGAGLIRAQVVTEGETLRLTIADAGIGLPTGMGVGAGTRAGLGSSIVRALAAQLEVAVERTSAPGEGTQVSLCVPLQPPLQPPDLPA